MFSLTFQVFHNAISLCLSTSATMWHIFKSYELLSVQPLFVPCCSHFSGFLHFLRVWPCFFTVLALCYQFLYFSYLGHFDHVALTFQVFFTFYTMFFHSFGPLLPLFIFFLPWSFGPCCTHLVFFLPDHVFLLFSATTFYIFLTLVILTMLHSLFRFSSLFTCLTMFFHCFGPLLPLFIFFLPWSFWPCCTHFSGFLHFLRVWPCFFTVLALCYHFLYFSYLGHFDHVALTFQVFFTSGAWAPLLPCGTSSDHYSFFHLVFWHVAATFYTVLALCYHFLYFSYLGHFDHVALTFQVFFTFYVSDHVFSLFWPSATTFYIFLTLVILTMLHSLFRFTPVFTCLTMLFHSFGPLLPLFIFFLPWSFWPCFQVFTFYMSDNVFSLFWHCYQFLYFSYLGHFDHVALTFQVFTTFYVSVHVFSLFWPSATTFYIFPWSFWPCALTFQLHFLRVWPCCFGPLLPIFIFFLLFWPCCTFFSQCNQVLEHLCYHVAHIQVSTSNIKRVTATFCSAVLSSHFDHVFFTFYVSDHVFSLFWPSATTFYIFLTLVILTMLHSLFRFSSLFTCLTMFFHCFGPLLPLFIFFLPWSFWPCCTHFSGFLHFWCVWPCFFHSFGICYHFLYFSYLGHFDHVALTFQVFFTFYVSDHVFSLFWPSATTFYIFLTLVILTMLHSLFRFSSLLLCLTMFFHSFGICYHFLYFSYLGHFDHVALTFQVGSQCSQVFEVLCYHVAQVQVCASNIKRVTATFCLLVLSSNFDHVFVIFTCLALFFRCFGPLVPLVIFLFPWSKWPCSSHFSGCFSMLSGSWGPLLSCGTSSSLCKQY